MTTLNLKTAIDDFLCYLLEKGLSPNTKMAYERDSRRLLNFLNSAQISNFAEMTKSTIEKYIEHISEENLADTSIARHVKSLKSLFYFLKRENYISTNIAASIPIPKCWKRLPEVLTIQQVERILNQPDVNTFNGLRNRAVLELLYAAGLRASELCKLKFSDLYRDDDFTMLKVQGKGDKERLVPVGSEADKAVEQYLLRRSSYFQRGIALDDYLFVSCPRNNKLKTEAGTLPLDRHQVWRIFKSCAQKAHIRKKGVSPHTMRHSFATHLLKGGADLRVLQSLLGHSDISSTDRYLNIGIDHVQEKFRQFHNRMENPDRITPTKTVKTVSISGYIPLERWDAFNEQAAEGRLINSSGIEWMYNRDQGEFGGAIEKVQGNIIIDLQKFLNHWEGKPESALCKT